MGFGENVMPEKRIGPAGGELQLEFDLAGLFSRARCPFPPPFGIAHEMSPFVSMGMHIDAKPQEKMMPPGDEAAYLTHRP
jgi:hypothetical protein